jgi:hypothetical protein
MEKSGIDTPTWDGSITGWTQKHISMNGWRTSRTHDQNDLIQEAFFIFDKCIKRYVTHYEDFNNKPAGSPAHFMSLYMNAWNNRFTDLVRYEKKIQRSTTFSDTIYENDESEDDEHHVINLIPACAEDSSLTLKIREASSEIKTVLSLFMDAPSELVDLAMSSWKKNGKLKPAENSHLCELLGFDKSTTNIVKIFEDHFIRT